MPINEGRRRRHLVVTGTATSAQYAPTGRGPRLRTPPRNRDEHAGALLGQFAAISEEYATLAEERDAAGFDPRAGLVLHFESSPDFDLKFESLDLRPQGIQLLSVRTVAGKTIAVCYVPDGKLDHFVRRIEQYRTQDTMRGAPKHRALVESIEAVQIAAIDALWTDREAPPADDEVAWWEVWLRTEDAAAVDSLRQAAEVAGFTLSLERLRFPERTVVTAQCTKMQLSRSLRLVNSVAELRGAKETAAPVNNLPPQEQYQLSDDLLARISVQDGTNTAACLLDTGVAQPHPLLAVALQPKDCLAYKPEWGAEDQDDHGTAMAGLSLYGSLLELLNSDGPVALEHCLESVKVLNADDPSPPHLWGEVTIRGVSLAEEAAPERRRAIGMAVTCPKNEPGQPTTWSAAVDSLTSGYTDDHQRLLLVAAGNTPPHGWHDHPAGCQAAGVHDPGQAWNALTIGAYTELVNIAAADFPDWQVVAASGDVSPYSCTSSTWERPWPIKPEILLEGGNCAVDPTFHLATQLDPLSLLTTYRLFLQRPFSTIMMTSAATALATRYAAVLQARYGDFWPETIRGLLVHSAEWTPAMRQHFQPLDTREQRERLLRYCGYGAPDFDRACWSASNELTLVAQDSLQPYDRQEGRYKTKDINYHTLPWPTDVLRELRETPVVLRITLSYFIEPSPARRGWKGRYRYASHALRFQVRMPTETEEQFKQRVNLAARTDDNEGQTYEGDAAQWTLGPQLRHLGSIHSDWLEGTAADIANRDMIAVYPVVGWWRERHHLGRWDRQARYSLIVSLRTPSEDIDIYTPVLTQITAPVAVEIETPDDED